MEFVGKAERLKPGEIESVAAAMGIDPAAFRAVVEVEAAGSGFDKKGRPKALFERHKFYQQLNDAPGLRSRAVSGGLAYPRWGQMPYPKTSDGVYDEIERACAIDEEAALMSTSWGLGQVLGQNFRMVKCQSVHEMVEEAKASEAGQLRQMAAFIRSAGLADELKAKDWAKFARGYNGPQFAQNKYDQKLAAAYAKLA